MRCGVCRGNGSVPRLLLGGAGDLMRVEPNPPMEVGPLFFHPKEVDEIYNFIQRRLVPSPDTAPFPTVVPVPLAPATRQTLRNTRPIGLSPRRPPGGGVFPSPGRWGVQGLP